MTKWSARLAIGFAVFLALAEVRRNWGDWGYAPFWIVDFIAVALLLYGGVRTLRRGARAGLPALAGGWGFACAMYYAVTIGGFAVALLAGTRDAPAPEAA